MNPMQSYYGSILEQLPVRPERGPSVAAATFFGKLGNDLDILVKPACGLEEAVIEFRDAGWEVATGEYEEVDGHWFSAKKLLDTSAGTVLVNALVSLDAEWLVNMHSGAQVCRLLHLAKIPVPKDLRVAVHQLLAEFKEPEEAAGFLKPEPTAGESYRAAFYADAAKDFEG